MSALAQLIDRLGAGAVVVDPDVVVGAATDWTGRFVGAPDALVRPGDLDQVRAVIDWARHHGIGVVPLGGNTGLVGATAAPTGTVLVSLERLRTIGDLDPDAGTLTAQAGATVAEVQAAASSIGWAYGVDFAARDSATIGGSIATNAGGLRVIRHGMTRAHVLGIEAVLGDGTVVRRLHGLRKDNTGFDLAGLLCGSEGTLGIVTAARLRLVAPPQAPVTALVGLDSVAAAVALVGRVRRAIPTLEAAEVYTAAGVRLVEETLGRSHPLETCPVVVVIEADGPGAAEDLATVIDETAAVRDVAVATDGPGRRTLWAVREAHTEAIARIGDVLKFDVTLPAVTLDTFADEIAGRVAAVDPAATTWLFGHVGDGNLHVNVTGARAERADALTSAVLGAVVERQGSISAEHGVGRAKAPWLHLDRHDGDRAAMVAIKAALDPDGIMNPGVLFA